MTRELVLLFALVLCLSFMIIEVDGHNPGYEIVAVYGSTPIVDGVVHIDEWNDASTESIDDNTTFFVKQNSANLYVAFNISDSTYSQYDMAGIYIDVDNDGNATLQADDISFVVCRDNTLFEGNVTAGAWAFTNVSNWTAQVFTTLNWWQVEFNITYAKINIVAGVEKTIGTAFLRSNNGGPASTWPSTGFSHDSPATWGDTTSTEYDWIPEFQTFYALTLFMIATILAVIVYKRRHIDNDRG